MAVDRNELRWNGWGKPGDQAHIGDRENLVEAWLKESLNLPALSRTPSVAAEDVALPNARLGPSLQSSLDDILGPGHVTGAAMPRLRRALGQSYHDILRLRAGSLPSAPDFIVAPGNADDVAAILDFCDTEGIAVVPGGGGTSVVGGVTAKAGPAHAGVVSLDMSRMNRVISIVPEDRVARIEAGAYGPDLEAALAARGFTLGHFPQSFEFSTLGGWIMHRGSGQLSARYGRAERWFISGRLAAPGTQWASESFPGSAGGPRMGDLIAGSEGTLGVLTDATVRITPRPESRDYRGFLFRSFEEGAAAVRDLAQSGIPIAMARLSDVAETRFYQSFGGLGKQPPNLATRLGMAYVRTRGYLDHPAALILGVEGGAKQVAQSVREARDLLSQWGALHIGRGPGRNWWQGRFHGPYLRDPLLDWGLGVDTLETSAHWSNLTHLYTAVGAAIRQALAEVTPAGTTPAILCHISHIYPDGASLYFTFIFPRDLEDPVRQWWHVKKAATDAIVAHGGTISHHHGVGEDHRPWIEVEKDGAALAMLRAAKRTLDPAGILNPGKLLPD